MSFTASGQPKLSLKTPRADDAARAKVSSYPQRNKVIANKKPTVLPHSIEAEQGLLCSMMLEGGKAIPEVRRYIPSKHFLHVPAHAVMYEALCGMWDSGKGIDLITFTQFLRDKGQLEEVGGAGNVTSIYLFVPTSANMLYYAELIRDKFLLREMIRTGTNMVRAAYGIEDDPNEALESFSAQFDQIKRVAGGPNGATQFDFDKLMGFNSSADPDCLVGNRYIVRGANSLWCAGSGYGKSSLAIQLAVYWACGQRCFGLRPVRPLKSLIIEAENDEGDMSEQLQGVIKGVASLGEIDLDKSHELIRTNIGIYRAIGKTGGEFLSLLDNLVAINRPDMVWIDPLFAFSGCDLLNPERTGHFLRNGLFPLADRHRVALNVIHHIGKPVRDPSKSDNSGIADIDYQYLGFGTSEIQNSFRAVNILVPVGNTGVSKLVFSKRGERAGASDSEGRWTRSVYLQHSKEGICWLSAEQPERPIGGSAKLKYSNEHILEEMSVANGVSVVELQKKLKDEAGMSSATFYRLWDGLKKAGQVTLEAEGKWIKKSKIALKNL